MMKSWKKQIFYFVMIAGFLVIIAALIAGCTSSSPLESNIKKVGDSASNDKIKGTLYSATFAEKISCPT